MIDLCNARVNASAKMHGWASGHDYRCAWLVECLNRHTADDWGDIDPHDQAANDERTMVHVLRRFRISEGFKARILTACAMAPSWRRWLRPVANHAVSVLSTCLTHRRTGDRLLREAAVPLQGR